MSSQQIDWYQHSSFENYAQCSNASSRISESESASPTKFFKLLSIALVLSGPFCAPEAATHSDYIANAQVNTFTVLGSNVNYNSAYGEPVSANSSSSISSGLTGLGQPTEYVAVGSATSAPFGGPLSSGNPFVSTSVNSDTTTVAGAVASLDYFISVDGQEGAVVPVNFELLFQAYTGNFFNGQVVYGGDEATALFSLKISDSQTSSLIASFGCGYQTNATCGNISYQYSSASFLTKSNTEYKISMFVNVGTANVSTSGLGINFAFANAYLDPYIYVDPAFSNADQFSISLSNGLANVPLPAVPEPETWALLLAGITFLAVRYSVTRRTAN